VLPGVTGALVRDLADVDRVRQQRIERPARERLSAGTAAVSVDALLRADPLGSVDPIPHGNRTSATELSLPHLQPAPVQNPNGALAVETSPAAEDHDQQSDEDPSPVLLGLRPPLVSSSSFHRSIGWCSIARGCTSRFGVPMSSSARRARLSRDSSANSPLTLMSCRWSRALWRCDFKISIPTLAIEYRAHLDAACSRSRLKGSANHRAEQLAVDFKHDWSKHFPAAMSIAGKGGARNG
jgi:hypothetical protein